MFLRALLIYPIDRQRSNDNSCPFCGRGKGGKIAILENFGEQSTHLYFVAFYFIPTARFTSDNVI